MPGRLGTVDDIAWPEDWQAAACAALVPYLGADVRVRIVVGPPTARDGTLIEGFVDLDGDVPMCVYDRSGRPSVYPWRLLRGPVLRIEELVPRRRPAVVFAHPEWSPPASPARQRRTVGGDS